LLIHLNGQHYILVLVFLLRHLQMQQQSQGRAAGSPLLLKAAGGMGCRLSVLGVRDVGSGKASLVELEVQVFENGTEPQVGPPAAGAASSL
jgi:hypothetical protein